jgi:hypothetical protein
MRYATEMGSGAMIYITSFIKIVPGIQKLMVEGGFRYQKPTVGFFFFSK